MAERLFFLWAVTVLLVTPMVVAQDVDPAALAEMTHLAGPLSIVRCNGNVAAVASVGDDGILLVDTGYAGTAQAAREVLNQLSEAPVRVIINTHGDGDHVGGNAVLGDSAMIVAHPFVREQMSSYFALPAAESSGVPTMTVADETTLYFNGDVIKILPVPGGHTAGDVVVHFTKSNVVCLGDIVLTGTFPDAGPVRGGNAQKLTEVLRKLAATLPEDAILVPGHGENITLDGLQGYIAMVEGTLAAVRREMAAGRTLEETITANPLVPWAEWERAEDGLAFSNWITQIYASLGDEVPRSICDPLTETLVTDGLEAAVSTYHRLKAQETEGWSFDENQLNMLGYQLLQRGMNTEAVEIFRLNVEAYPEGFNAYDSLGEAYAATGQTELAVANYQRSLELNPDNGNATAMLQQLQQ